MNYQLLIDEINQNLSREFQKKYGSVSLKEGAGTLPRKYFVCFRLEFWAYIHYNYRFPSTEQFKSFTLEVMNIKKTWVKKKDGNLNTKLIAKYIEDFVTNYGEQYKESLIAKDEYNELKKELQRDYPDFYLSFSSKTTRSSVDQRIWFSKRHRFYLGIPEISTKELHAVLKLLRKLRNVKKPKQ